LQGLISQEEHTKINLRIKRECKKQNTKGVKNHEQNNKEKFSHSNGQKRSPEN